MVTLTGSLFVYVDDLYGSTPRHLVTLSYLAAPGTVYRLLRGAVAAAAAATALVKLVGGALL